MEQVKEELIPKGKIIKNEYGDRIEYFFDKKFRINRMKLYGREKYVTIEIKRTKGALSIKIQYPTKRIIFDRVLTQGSRIAEQINAWEIFYVDFLETYAVEKGIDAFIKYVVDYVQGLINDIFYPFQSQT